MSVVCTYGCFKRTQYGGGSIFLVATRDNAAKKKKSHIVCLILIGCVLTCKWQSSVSFWCTEGWLNSDNTAQDLWNPSVRKSKLIEGARWMSNCIEMNGSPSWTILVDTAAPVAGRGAGRLLLFPFSNGSTVRKVSLKAPTACECKTRLNKCFCFQIETSFQEKLMLYGVNLQRKSLFLLQSFFF